MPRWPCALENRIGRGGRSAEPGKRSRGAGGAWPPPVEKHPHRSFSWGNDGPGPPRTVQGRSARCGNTLSDQSTRLRLKINLQKQMHLRIATERKRVRVSSLSLRKHFPVGYSLYDVYERFRHRMVSRLVFPSISTSSIARDLPAFVHATGNTAVADAIYPRLTPYFNLR